MDAVLFAANYQKQGITVELIQKDPEIKLEEYLQYATKLSRKELYYLSGGTPVVYPLG